jgi:hypothetical protein
MLSPRFTAPRWRLAPNTVTRVRFGLWRRRKLFSVQAEFGPNYRGDFPRIRLNHAIRRLKSKPRLGRRGHSARKLPRACRIPR